MRVRAQKDFIANFRGYAEKSFVWIMPLSANPQEIDFKGYTKFFSRRTKPTVFSFNRFGRERISCKIRVGKIEEIARRKPSDCLRNVSHQAQIVARKPPRRSDKGIFVSEKMLSQNEIIGFRLG